MPEADDPSAPQSPPQPLSYSKVSPRRRWRTAALLVLILLSGWFTYQRLAPTIQDWWRREQVWDALHQTRLPTTRAVLNDSAYADRDVTSVLGFYEQQVQAHMSAPPNVATQIMQISSPQINRLPFMWGTMFLGTVRSPAGHERLLIVNLTNMAFADEHAAAIDLNCQLYTAGSFWHPQITATGPTKPMAMGMLPATWQRLPGVWYDWGAKIEVGSARRDDADPSQIRLPIWCNDSADELILQLHDDDTLSGHVASGGDLPRLVNFKPKYKPW